MFHFLYRLTYMASHFPMNSLTVGPKRSEVQDKKVSDVDLQEINYVTLIYQLWSVFTHVAMSYANLLGKMKKGFT